MESTTSDITPFQQIISACSGALVTSLFVNPLDVVKIRLQKQVKQDSSQKEKNLTLKDKRVSWASNNDSYRKIVLKRCVTPLDVIKVRLQTQQRPMTAGRCFIYCNGLMDHICTCEPLNLTAKNQMMWYARPSQFNGTLDAFAKIARTEGLASLWSGLPPTLLMAVPATVVYFTLYDNTMIYLNKSYTYQPWMPMIAGGCARIACVTLISPLEMIRTKLQSEKLKYIEIWKAVRIATNHRGMTTLWTGLGSTLLRDVPFSCIYWVFYETIKRRLNNEFSRSKFFMSFVSGAVAGSFAAIITCPFDVIKTHKQIELGERHFIKDYKSKPSSTLKLMGTLYKRDGIKALFTGLTPRVIKVAPACAIMIGTYEYLKHIFTENNRRRKSNGI